MRISRSVRAALAVLLAAGTLAACGSSGGSSATTPSTTSPEEKVVPAAQVTAGLADVRAIATGLPAGLASNPAQARTDVDRMYAKWFTFEGTVRKNDQNLYLTMEDGLSGMKIGVQGNKPDRVTRGLADFQQAADAYLKKHP
jgi:hypothetical protein